MARNIYILLYQIVCDNLFLKQLVSNSLYLQLAILMQANRMDNVYLINIVSAAALVVFTCFVLTQSVSVASGTGLSYLRLRDLKGHARTNHFSSKGAVYLKFDVRQFFFRNYFWLNLLRKLVFTSMLTLLYWHPALCLSVFLLQQAAWVVLLLYNPLNKAILKNVLLIFGEIQLLIS